MAREQCSGVSQCLRCGARCINFRALVYWGSRAVQVQHTEARLCCSFADLLTDTFCKPANIGALLLRLSHMYACTMAG